MHSPEKMAAGNLFQHLYMFRSGFCKRKCDHRVLVSRSHFTRVHQTGDRSSCGTLVTERRNWCKSKKALLNCYIKKRSKLDEVHQLTSVGQIFHYARSFILIL